MYLIKPFLFSLFFFCTTGSYLYAQNASLPLELFVRTLLTKPAESTGFSSAIKISPQVQLKFGKGKVSLNSEFGSGLFRQHSISDEHSELISYNKEFGNSKWNNTYFALGPNFRWQTGNNKNIFIDFSLLGAVSINKAEAYRVEFYTESTSAETIQENSKQKKTFAALKPAITFGKHWGNWGLNIYSSWLRNLGEFSYSANKKDLSNVNFNTTPGIIAQQIRAAPILKMNNKFPGSFFQVGAGFSYNFGRKENNGNADPAKANINTSRSNIKQQVAAVDSSGTDGNAEPAKANINTSRSNIKQQVAAVDSSGTDGNADPAKANINTSRSNIKQQVAAVDSSGADGNADPAKANINYSRSNIKQQVATVDSSGADGNVDPAKANINTSRSNIKQQVAAVDSSGADGNADPAKANINTSRSNIKQQVAAVDSSGADGNADPAKANINTSRSNIKQQVSVVDTVSTDGNIYQVIFDLKEVKELAVKFNMQKADKKMVLIINKRPDESFNYYWVQAGSSDNLGFQPVYNFYVKPDNFKVLFFDTVIEKALTLEEWRKSRNW